MAGYNPNNQSSPGIKPKTYHLDLPTKPTKMKWESWFIITLSTKPTGN